MATPTNKKFDDFNALIEKTRKESETKWETRSRQMLDDFDKMMNGSGKVLTDNGKKIAKEMRKLIEMQSDGSRKTLARTVDNFGKLQKELDTFGDNFDKEVLDTHIKKVKRDTKRKSRLYKRAALSAGKAIGKRLPDIGAFALGAMADSPLLAIGARAISDQVGNAISGTGRLIAERRERKAADVRRLESYNVEDIEQSRDDFQLNNFVDSLIAGRKGEELSDKEARFERVMKKTAEESSELAQHRAVFAGRGGGVGGVIDIATFAGADAWTTFEIIIEELQEIRETGKALLANNEDMTKSIEKQVNAVESTNLSELEVNREDNRSEKKRHNRLIESLSNIKLGFKKSMSKMFGAIGEDAGALGSVISGAIMLTVSKLIPLKSILSFGKTIGGWIVKGIWAAGKFIVVGIGKALAAIFTAPALIIALKVALVAAVAAAFAWIGSKISDVLMDSVSGYIDAINELETKVAEDKIQAIKRRKAVALANEELDKTEKSEAEKLAIKLKRQVDEKIMELGAEKTALDAEQGIFSRLFGGTNETARRAAIDSQLGFLGNQRNARIQEMNSFNTPANRLNDLQRQMDALNFGGQNVIVNTNNVTNNNSSVETYVPTFSPKSPSSMERNAAQTGG